MPVPPTPPWRASGACFGRLRADGLVSDAEVETARAAAAAAGAIRIDLSSRADALMGLTMVVGMVTELIPFLLAETDIGKWYSVPKLGPMLIP